MNPKVALIDYGASNLRSVEKALQASGAVVTRVETGRDLGETDAIVVPGQGHFGRAMEELRGRGFEEALSRKVIEKKIPYIGICIGFQILFEQSEEAPGVRGLGWFPGKVVRFRGDIKIPHMGWNEVHARATRPHPALSAFFYFVHSFYPVPSDPSITAATCDYGGDFTCAVSSENIFAVQFHPEKSQSAGLTLLKSLLPIRRL